MTQTTTGSQDTRTECLERQMDRDDADDPFLFPQPLSKQRSKELLWANYGLKARRTTTRPKSTAGGGRPGGRPGEKAQRETEAKFWSTAVAMEETWQEDRDHLIKENQLVGKRLDAMQARVRFLEGELRTKEAKVRKGMAHIDDKSNRILYMHVTAAASELRGKQVRWGKEKRALQELFKGEIEAMEAGFDHDRRAILLERDALFRERRAVAKKLRFAEQAVADMEQHLEMADHEVQDKKEILLRNLRDFEKKFTQLPVDAADMSKGQLADKQDEVLLQLLVAKLTVHHIAAGKEGT